MTVPLIKTTVREDLLTLAYQALTFEHADFEADLKELSPLDRDAADVAFRELVAAVQVLHGINNNGTPWFEVIPDCEGSDRDEQALRAAETHVELALDLLTGEQS